MGEISLRPPAGGFCQACEYLEVEFYQFRLLITNTKFNSNQLKQKKKKKGVYWLTYWEEQKNVLNQVSASHFSSLFGLSSFSHFISWFHIFILDVFTFSSGYREQPQQSRPTSQHDYVTLLSKLECIKFQGKYLVGHPWSVLTSEPIILRDSNLPDPSHSPTH